jgi:hypothetical protein
MAHCGKAWSRTPPHSAQLAEVERERGEAAAHLSRIDSDVPECRQTLSKQQAEAIAATLQRRLLEAPKPLKWRYLRGLVSGIFLNREKAVITGPSSAIAATSPPATLTVRFSLLYGTGAPERIRTQAPRLGVWQ